jgi:hypothetical protein
MTYNPLTKQWINLGLDNFGGYYLSTSPGWVGSKMVWTIKATDDGTTGTATFTKVSDTETRYSVVPHDKSGKAGPENHGVCRKSQ